MVEIPALWDAKQRWPDDSNRPVFAILTSGNRGVALALTLWRQNRPEWKDRVYISDPGMVLRPREDGVPIETYGSRVVKKLDEWGAQRLNADLAFCIDVKEQQKKRVSWLEREDELEERVRYEHYSRHMMAWIHVSQRDLTHEMVQNTHHHLATVFWVNPLVELLKAQFRNELDSMNWVWIDIKMYRQLSERQRQKFKERLFPDRKRHVQFENVMMMRNSRSWTLTKHHIQPKLLDLPYLVSDLWRIVSDFFPLRHWLIVASDRDRFFRFEESISV